MRNFRMHDMQLPCLIGYCDATASFHIWILTPASNGGQMEECLLPEQIGEACCRYASCPLPPVSHCDKTQLEQPEIAQYDCEKQERKYDRMAVRCCLSHELIPLCPVFGLNSETPLVQLCQVYGVLQNWSRASRSH